MLRALVVIACIGTGLAWVLAPASATQASVHTVKMEAMQFQPPVLTVKDGDVIIWVNRDLVPHTATARGRNPFDSGVIPAGKSWRYQVHGEGRLDYVCLLHPTMRGALQIGPR